MLLSQSGYPFALVVAALLLIALFWLLRTQRLREKYSVLWFAVIVGVVLLTFIPSITGWLTALAGVTTPINLVFILAFLVLLVVCIQLSIEISSLEESARTVAEEVALLRLELERRTGGTTGSAGMLIGMEFYGVDANAPHSNLRFALVSRHQIVEGDDGGRAVGDRRVRRRRATMWCRREGPQEAGRHAQFRTAGSD